MALLFHLSEHGRRIRVPLASGRWRKLLDSEGQRWLGGGSAVPQEIDSDGTVELTVTPWSLVLWELMV